MALKSVPITPVEAHRLDDPRRRTSDPVESLPAASVPTVPDVSPPPTPAPRRRPARRTPRRGTGGQLAPAGAQPTAASPAPDSEPLINPYARGGRPHQVAVSLYVPQWERIEEQCAELRSQGIPDLTVTRWLFAVLHFRAPVEQQAAAQLLRQWARLEADEEGPYFGLRKEARGVRFFEALWERQRAVVADLRHGAGPSRPTLATWTTAVVELVGPKTAEEARQLVRELRILLAGDPG